MRIHRRDCLFCLGATASIVWSGGVQAAARRDLEVLHWWDSAAERLALDRMLEPLSESAPVWRSAPIPGGARSAARMVLRSRLLSGQAPDLAHVGLRDAQELALKGMLADLAPHNTTWPAVLHEGVRRDITVQGRVVAMPLGVHRLNTMIYHQGLWRFHGLPIPRTWEDVMQAASVLLRAGVSPMVWSDEGPFLMDVWNGLLLSELGPAAYPPAATAGFWGQSGVGLALQRLRELRALVPGWAVQSSSGRAVGRDFLLGRAGLWITSDAGRGELNAWGMEAQRDYGCVTLPGTHGIFLVHLDVLAAFSKGADNAARVQAWLPQLLDPVLQRHYNRAKGSVPVLRELSLQGLDPVELETWQAWLDPAVVKRPGLSHRLGMDGLRAELAAELLRDFVRTPKRSVAETQTQLVRLLQQASLA